MDELYSVLIAGIFGVADQGPYPDSLYAEEAPVGVDVRTNLTMWDD